MSSPVVYDVRLVFEQALVSESDLIRLKARLTAVALRLGFDAALTERTRMVASEMVTNQGKYGGGRGLLQVWEASIGSHKALDLFALDYGPGIADVGAALQDGFSTGGTLGKGLGGMRRLSHEFAVLSQTTASLSLPWHGTALWARFFAGKDRPGLDWDIGMYRRSYQNARACGDGFSVCIVGRKLRVLHLDALGHGVGAEDVVHAALEGFDCHRPLAQALAELESKPRMKRGAAVCCYECDEQGQLSWIGLGDMQACLLQGTTRQALSLRPGILGQVHGRMPGVQGVWPSGALLATVSDGLRSHWAQALASIGSERPQFIAYFMGQVFGRITDDRSCLVIRRGGH